MCPVAGSACKACMRGAFWRDHVTPGLPLRDIASQYPTGQWMKSARWIPIRQTSFEAQTLPRGVPAAAPFDHDHLRLPLHLIAAMSGTACFSFVQMAGVAL